MSLKLQGKLTAERMRTSGGWPKLKANVAATPHLAELIRDFGGAEGWKVVVVCQLLCRYYVFVVSPGPMSVSDEVKNELREMWRKFGSLYSALACEAA